MSSYSNTNQALCPCMWCSQELGAVKRKKTLNLTSMARLEPCRIYVHTAQRSVAQQHVPSKWAHNQYSVELWLQRSLHGLHPWRVHTIAEADLIFFASNFSLYCAAGRTYQRRLLWDELMSDSSLNNASRRTPSFLPLQYGGCAEPWVGATPLGHGRRKRPPSMLLLLDLALRKGADRRNHGVISPFVVASPPELVAETVAAPALTAADFGSRRLLFFAGHVPKLYLNPLRYRLWRQLRQYRANVTTLSSTLACTVGAYAPCQLSDADLAAKPPAFFTSFCHAFSASHCGLKPPFTGTCGGSEKNTPSRAVARFRRGCAAYTKIDFASELPEMLLDTRRLLHSEYVATAGNHRFCLVAPGDFASTHKVTEAMAIGGAGGCIPVFVISSGRSATRLDAAREVATVLPYTRWLDYCDVAFLVPSAVANNNFGRVIERLAAVGLEEAAAKLAALRRVRSAFIFREGSTVARPSAPEYLLSEACAAGQQWRSSGSSLFLPAAADLSRCTLV
jgi:hypothetical protein